MYTVRVSKPRHPGGHMPQAILHHRMIRMLAAGTAELMPGGMRLPDGFTGRLILD